MSIFNKFTQNYLTDKNIEDLVSSGKLFADSTFLPKQLSGCAYDLRAGKNLTSRNRGVVVEISTDGYVIQPGELVTIQTLEYIDLSNPLLMGLIVNSHTLLSLGLYHPITTIDPGFKGHLAVTLINHGNTGYRLCSEDRIVKLLLCPVSPTPNRIYGQQYRPRVIEGSLEHSLYVERYKLEKIHPSQLADYFGGPLADLVERVETLEKDSGRYRVEQQLGRYRGLLSAIGVIFAGAVGAILANYWPTIWNILTNLIKTFQANIP